MRFRSFAPAVALAGAALALPHAVSAQADTAALWRILRAETFVRPAERIVQMHTAPRTNIDFATLSPDHKWAVRLTGPGRGAISAYGQPHINLGGVQIDERANRARALTNTSTTGMEIADPRTGATRQLTTPAGATVAAPTWSPDGSKIAYFANFPTATYVYVADVATGRSTRLGTTPVLATLVTTPRWTPDGKAILVVVAPTNRGAVPTHGPNGIEDGPMVRFTEGKAKPQRVHFDLLEDPHDMAQLKYHTTGQVAVVDAKSGAARRVGAPGMISRVEASPDGRYFRVVRTVEPFSYIAPVSSFGNVTELWDNAGRVVETLATQPLREGEEGPGAAPGPGAGGPGGPGGRGAAPIDTSRRNFAWHPDGGLTYLQTYTTGEGRTRAAAGVRFVHWKAPFGAGDTATIYTGTSRLTTVAWGSDKGTLFVNDSGQVAAVRLADTGKRYPLGRGVTLPAGGGGFGGGGGGFGGAGNQPADTVGTGGALQTETAADGRTVVNMSADGQYVFVSGIRRYGNDWHTRAPRPWLDKIKIEDAARSRLLDSPAATYEQFVTALNADYSQVVVTRQNATTIEDAWFRDLTAGTERQLTRAVDPAPEISGAIRKRIQVTRPRDGTKLWVNVALPRDWRPGTTLPGVIWFYPYEYATADAYARSKWTVNINQFPVLPQTRPASAMELWVAGGYAYINPDVPIFGDSGRMNDNYTRDLRENLDAILDAVVDSGFVTRDHIGLGGHSYGAFSTVNAMTLVPYFQAGIAGDGMYNRTLTPFGFQSERRNFWEAQDMYLDMSPFLRADKLSGALLMYHATEDQNAGTHPISSWRMMAALQGLGKNAALYFYPYEDHSVATFESDLDLWARWYAWFDLYVKR